jgi:hypothetical protein
MKTLEPVAALPMHVNDHTPDDLGPLISSGLNRHRTIVRLAGEGGRPPGQDRVSGFRRRDVVIPHQDAAEATVTRRTPG